MLVIVLPLYEMYKGSVAAEEKEEALNSQLTQMENHLDELKSGLETIRTRKNLERLGLVI